MFSPRIADSPTLVYAALIVKSVNLLHRLQTQTLLGNSPSAFGYHLRSWELAGARGGLRRLEDAQITVNKASNQIKTATAGEALRNRK